MPRIVKNFNRRAFDLIAPNPYRRGAARSRRRRKLTRQPTANVSNGQLPRWLSGDDVMTYATDDGNTQTSSSPTIVTQVNLKGDEYGSVIESDYTVATGGAGSLTESSGLQHYTASISGSVSSKHMGLLVPDLSNFSIERRMQPVAITNNSSNQFILGILDDVGGFGPSVRFFRDTTYQITGLQNGSDLSTVDFGASLPETIDIKIDRSTDTYSIYYSLNGASYVLLDTYTEDLNLSLLPVSSMSAAVGQSITCDLNYLRQLSGPIYWPDVITSLKNKKFVQAKTINWSSFTSTEVGTVTYDYSVNGGTSYTGTYRTKAQMQALSNEIASQLELKVKHNGGSQTSASSATAISVGFV